MHTTANFIAHCRAGVRNLTTAVVGYAHAIQRSDVQPAGRILGRGGGRRGGHGERGIPYVKVFVYLLFHQLVPNTVGSTVIKAIMVLTVEILNLLQLRKLPRTTVMFIIIHICIFHSTVFSCHTF